MLRRLAIILLLAGVGFLIYGVTQPNNPPDLIVGGVIGMVGAMASFGLGAVLLVISFFMQKPPEP